MINNNPLANIFNSPLSFKTGGQTTPAFIGQPAVETKTQTLPYGGGTFNPSGGAEIKPTPIFSGAAAAAPAVAPATEQVDLYEKYRDPKTGEIMTPEEYAIYLADRVPKGSGQIPNYAGDAMTNPDESQESLMNRARNLTNARNDIATGTEDPYGVGNKSGIAYSPAELRAIEKAYAGVYDPALNDVFARLEKKQKEEDAKAAREEIVFRTNEAIRQWRATTGTKSSGSGEKSLFTQSQLNDGASNAGLGIDAFKSLDNDIKNFYINPPMGLNDDEKKVPMYSIFEEDLLAIANGDADPEEVISNINSSNLPAPVKHYFIDQVPDVPEKEKEGWFKRVWGAITGK